MRPFGTMLGLGIPVAGAAFLMFASRRMLGASLFEVLRWWWVEGEGKVPILFTQLATLGFWAMFFLWLLHVVHAIVGRPEVYVFLGPHFYRGDYYYRLDDPQKQRFLLQATAGEDTTSARSHLDSLFVTHWVIRHGPRPQDADRALSFNLRSRLVSVAFQAGLLMFGLAGLAQIAIQFAAGHEIALTADRWGPLLTGLVGTLVVVYAVGLWVGQRNYRYKLDGFSTAQFEHIREFRPGPGSVIEGRLIDRMGKRIDGTSNRSALEYYLVEIPVDGEPPVTAQFSLYRTRSSEPLIRELDGMVRRKETIRLRVNEDYSVEPVLFEEAEVETVSG